VHDEFKKMSRTDILNKNWNYTKFIKKSLNIK
jgi:hypothetical protein